MEYTKGTINIELRFEGKLLRVASAANHQLQVCSFTGSIAPLFELAPSIKYFSQQWECSSGIFSCRTWQIAEESRQPLISNKCVCLYQTENDNKRNKIFHDYRLISNCFTSSKTSSNFFFSSKSSFFTTKMQLVGRLEVTASPRACYKFINSNVATLELTKTYGMLFSSARTGR